MTAPTTGKITRQDIEAKLRQVRGEVESVGDSARSVGSVATIVGGVVVVGIAYLLGRKRGKGKSTVVEIRRV